MPGKPHYQLLQLIQLTAPGSLLRLWQVHGKCLLTFCHGLRLHQSDFTAQPISVAPPSPSTLLSCSVQAIAPVALALPLALACIEL